MKPISSQEYHDNTKARAIEAFKDHRFERLVHKDNGRGRWRIRRAGTSIYSAEVISLWGAGLYVGGDIEPVVFGHFGETYEDVAPYHLAKLRWIGKCDDIGYYVHQKAAMGMRDNGAMASQWVPGVALWQLQDSIKDCNVEEVDRVSDVMANVLAGCDRYEVMRQGSKKGLCQVGYDLGMVCSARVIYAWAACNRLCELLEA